MSAGESDPRLAAAALIQAQVMSASADQEVEEPSPGEKVARIQEPPILELAAPGGFEVLYQGPSPQPAVPAQAAGLPDSLYASLGMTKIGPCSWTTPENATVLPAEYAKEAAASAEEAAALAEKAAAQAESSVNAFDTVAITMTAEPEQVCPASQPEEAAEPAAAEPAAEPRAAAAQSPAVAEATAQILPSEAAPSPPLLPAKTAAPRDEKYSSEAAKIRAAAEASPPAPAAVREYSSAHLVGAIERVGMGRALDCTPTHALLRELMVEGFQLPDADELLELSKQLCGWLEQYRKVVLDENSAPTWFNLCEALRYSNKRSLLLLPLLLLPLLLLPLLPLQIVAPRTPTIAAQTRCSIRTAAASLPTTSSPTRTGKSARRPRR